MHSGSDRRGLRRGGGADNGSRNSPFENDDRAIIRVIWFWGGRNEFPAIFCVGVQSGGVQVRIEEKRLRLIFPMGGFVGGATAS